MVVLRIPKSKRWVFTKSFSLAGGVSFLLQKVDSPWVENKEEGVVYVHLR